MSFLELQKESLETVSDSLKELLSDQDAVAETVKQESINMVTYGDVDCSATLKLMLDKTQLYLTKIEKLKAEMASISQHSAALKEQSAKLQKETLSDMMRKEEVRNKKREFEKKLIAKPAKSHMPS